MSAYDTNLAVQQFTTQVQLLSQQEGSKLETTVMTAPHYGEQAVAVDQYVPVNATERTGRYEPLVPYDTQNDRRWVTPRNWDWDDLIDNFDKLVLLNDPTSSYVKSAVYALGRSKDDVIIDAIFGTAKTGKTGSTNTSFLAANQMDVGYGSASATGLNTRKILHARKILMSYDIDLDNDQLYCIITAQQNEDLLNEIQFVDGDFTNTKRLDDGRLKSHMGVNFIHCERLPVNGSGYRRVPLYCRSGMHLGIWQDLKISIDQRKDLSSLPWQVYAMQSVGATRTEEKKVIEIPCMEPS